MLLMNDDSLWQRADGGKLFSFRCKLPVRHQFSFMKGNPLADELYFRDAEAPDEHRAIESDGWGNWRHPSFSKMADASSKYPKDWKRFTRSKAATGLIFCNEISEIKLTNAPG